MVVHVEELISVLVDLCKERDLKATVYGSVKGGLTAGLFAILGGLLLGPVGLAAGGALGGGLTALNSRNSFRSVAVVLYEMEHHKKQKLYNKVKDAFRDFGIADVAELSVLIRCQTSLQELAMREVANFVKQEFNLSIL